MIEKEFGIRQSNGDMVTYPYCECERIFYTRGQAEDLIEARGQDRYAPYQIVTREVTPWIPA